MKTPFFFILGFFFALQLSAQEVYQLAPLPPKETPPHVTYQVSPVYPFELLRDGATGTAEVQFLVNPNGGVEQAKVIQAERPEFGQAVLAMIDQWKFQPAMKEGKPTWGAPMHVKKQFSDFLGDAPVSDETLHLLRELKKENPALCPPKDLDAPPQLVSQHPPVFPSTLLGKVTEGQAVVEFLIDRDGNVQLPRVISVTDPAFGYAAVQGVSMWKFTSPTSHGNHVDIRVQIPINFVAPRPPSQPAPLSPRT